MKKIQVNTASALTTEMVTVKAIVKGSVLKLHNKLLANMSADYHELTKEQLKAVRNNVRDHIRNHVTTDKTVVKDSTIHKLIVDTITIIKQDIIDDLKSHVKVDHVHSEYAMEDGLAQPVASVGLFDIVGTMVSEYMQELEPYIGELHTPLGKIKRSMKQTIFEGICSKYGMNRYTEVDEVLERVIFDNIVTWITNRTWGKEALQRKQDAQKENNMVIVKASPESVGKAITAMKGASLGSVKTYVEQHVSNALKARSNYGIMTANSEVLRVLSRLNNRGLVSDMAVFPNSDILKDVVNELVQWENETFVDKLPDVELTDTHTVLATVESFVYEQVSKAFGLRIRDLIAEEVIANILSSLNSRYCINSKSKIKELSGQNHRTIIRSLHSWYTAFVRAVKEGAKAYE